MALINRAGQEISAKVVYYGPGLSGKTTNLEVLFRQVPEDSRGKMISMKTRTDRTLFFDLLPLSAESIREFQVRILLYTVPGQVYYNATRRLVLKGVDAVVFVADSQRGKMEENLESLENLRSNIADMNLKLDDLPWVIQYNKRDLPDVLSVAELNQALNPTGVPSFTAVAPRGEGVQETLAGISQHLRPRLMELVKKELGESIQGTCGEETWAHHEASQAPEPAAMPRLTPRMEPSTASTPTPQDGPPSEAPVSRAPKDEGEAPASSENTILSRRGLDLDRLPDPPVVEMPAHNPGEPYSLPDLDSLMGKDDLRHNLHELETTIQASPLNSLAELATGKERRHAVPPPELVEMATTDPRPASPVSETAAIEPPRVEVPARPASPPAPPARTEPAEESAEILELQVPRRLLAKGQLTLRLLVMDEAAEPAPAPPSGQRVALRDGELVPLD